MHTTKPRDKKLTVYPNMPRYRVLPKVKVDKSLLRIHMVPPTIRGAFEKYGTITLQCVDEMISIILETGVHPLQDGTYTV